MNRELYAIIDTVAKDISGQLIVVRNINEAIRWFGDLIMNPNTTVGAHPQDHKLVTLGTIAITDGEVDNIPIVKLVITGAELHRNLTAEA